MGKIALSQLLVSENYIAPKVDKAIIQNIKNRTINRRSSLILKFVKYYVPVGIIAIMIGSFYYFSRIDFAEKSDNIKIYKSVDEYSIQKESNQKIEDKSTNDGGGGGGGVGFSESSGMGRVKSIVGVPGGSTTSLDSSSSHGKSTIDGEVAFVLMLICGINILGLLWGIIDLIGSGSKKKRKEMATKIIIYSAIGLSIGILIYFVLKNYSI